MTTKEKAYERAKKKAEKVVGDPEKVKKIVNSALNKATSSSYSAQFQEIADKLQALVRLVKSWINKEYRSTPWQTIILAVTALVYFVTPFDAIFDFIPLLGFADDVAILTAVLSSINHDLDKFIEWEQNLVQNDEPSVSAVDADFEEVAGEGKAEG